MIWLESALKRLFISLAWECWYHNSSSIGEITPILPVHQHHNWVRCGDFFFFLYFHLTPCRVLHCCVINWPEFNSAPSDTTWQTALPVLSQLQYCGTRSQSTLLWFKCWLRTLVFCAQPAPRLVLCWWIWWGHALNLHYNSYLYSLLQWLEVFICALPSSLSKAKDNFVLEAFCYSNNLISII